MHAEAIVEQPVARTAITFAFRPYPLDPLLSVPFLIVLVAAIFTIRQRRKFRNSDRHEGPLSPRAGGRARGRASVL